MRRDILNWSKTAQQRVVSRVGTHLLFYDNTQTHFLFYSDPCRVVFRIYILGNIPSKESLYLPTLMGNKVLSGSDIIVLCVCPHSTKSPAGGVSGVRSESVCRKIFADSSARIPAAGLHMKWHEHPVYQHQHTAICRWHPQCDVTWNICFRENSALLKSRPLELYSFSVV